jgi:hypothetical protein
MDKGRRFSVITLVGVSFLCLLTVPSILFTWKILRIWIDFRLHSRQVFYVEHWLDGSVLGLIFAAPFLLILAVLGALAAIHPSWPKSAALAVPAGITIALYTIICIPNVPLWHSELMQNANHLGFVEHLLDDWYRGHSRYPLTSEELQDALQAQDRIASPYGRAGERLIYELQFEPRESKPFKTESARPGIVYYAVDTRGEQFWLTVSGLNAPFAERASMARTDAFAASKQPWEGLLVVSDHIVRIREPETAP